MLLSLPVPGGTLPVTVAAPSTPSATAVLVVQEAFGVNAHIADIASRFADAGHLALAPHLFHRTGDPVLGYGDFPSVMPHMQALEPVGLAADVDACLVHLADLGVPQSKVAVVGFCMGGTVALWTGTRVPLGLAVSFYGGGVATGRFGLPSLLELAPTLQTPWLGLYGDQDQGIPVEEVEQLRAAAAASGVPTELVRYPAAGHGFHCDARDAFEPDSAADAWARTLAALASRLTPTR